MVVRMWFLLKEVVSEEFWWLEVLKEICCVCFVGFGLFVKYWVIRWGRLMSLLVVAGLLVLGWSVMSWFGFG